MDEKQKLDAAKAAMLGTKATLDSPAYFDGLSPNDQNTATIKSAELSTAILKIENTQIDEVAEKVRANAAELEKATADLAAADAKVENFTKLVAAAGTLLGIVGRILAL